MSPFEKNLAFIENDLFFKKMMEEKYSGKPIILIIGPPKSGTSWLHHELKTKIAEVAVFPDKDTEILQSLVAESKDESLLPTANRIELLKKMMKTRLAWAEKGYGGGDQGFARSLDPIINSINTIELGNLYGLFFPTLLMYKTKNQTSSFFYFDVKMAVSSENQLKRIKVLFAKLGCKILKIMMIIRDPVERFNSEVIHRIRDNGIVDNKRTNALFRMHYEYLKVMKKNKGQIGLHGEWLNKHTSKLQVPDWFWSRKIEGGSFFDEIVESSRLDDIYNRYVSVFDKRNVHCVLFKDLFKLESLSRLFSAMEIIGIDFQGIEFNRKINAGNYSVNSSQYNDVLRMFLSKQYDFIKSVPNVT